MALRIALDLRVPVDLSMMQPQMGPLRQIVTEVFAEHGYDAILTSVSDGDHTSIVHPLGFGLDWRIWHVKSKREMREITSEIKRRCGPQFDIVLESDHLHTEYDPR